jgi:NAD(P)-dependent dehydrogenase (short-subunit alcohol dehydrogenase family)
MRTKIQPVELADMVLFLCSDAARHITGQMIGVDGNIEWEA